MVSRFYPYFLETHFTQIWSRFYMDKIEMKGNGRASSLFIIEKPIISFALVHICAVYFFLNPSPLLLDHENWLLKFRS